LVSYTQNHPATTTPRQLVWQVNQVGQLQHQKNIGTEVNEGIQGDFWLSALRSSALDTFMVDGRCLLDHFFEFGRHVVNIDGRKEIVVVAACIPL
jgi:hypothetical protein